VAARCPEMISSALAPRAATEWVGLWLRTTPGCFLKNSEKGPISEGERMGSKVGLGVPSAGVHVGTTSVPSGPTRSCKLEARSSRSLLKPWTLHPGHSNINISPALIPNPRRMSIRSVTQPIFASLQGIRFTTDDPTTREARSPPLPWDLPTRPPVSQTETAAPAFLERRVQ